LNDNISDKDKKDWDRFISSNEKLPNKDFEHQKKKKFQKKILKNKKKKI